MFISIIIFFAQKDVFYFCKQHCCKNNILYVLIYVQFLPSFIIVNIIFPFLIFHKLYIKNGYELECLIIFQDYIFLSTNNNVPSFVNSNYNSFHS